MFVPRPGLLPLEECDGVAVLEGHDGLLPVGAAAQEAADALVLPAGDVRAHAGDLDPEELLHRALHLDLGGLAVHLEGVLPARLPGPLRLLADDGADDDVLRDQVHDSASSTLRAESAVSTRYSGPRMS